MTARQTIPLNAALRTVLTEAQAKVTLATVERDAIVRTILASQAVTEAGAWELTDAGLVVSSTEPMP